MFWKNKNKPTNVQEIDYILNKHLDNFEAVIKSVSKLQGEVKSLQSITHESVTKEVGGLRSENAELKLQIKKMKLDVDTIKHGMPKTSDELFEIISKRVNARISDLVAASVRDRVKMELQYSFNELSKYIER